MAGGWQRFGYLLWGHLSTRIPPQVCPVTTRHWNLRVKENLGGGGAYYSQHWAGERWGGSLPPSNLLHLFLSLKDPRKHAFPQHREQ